MQFLKWMHKGTKPFRTWNQKDLYGQANGSLNIMWHDVEQMVSRCLSAGVSYINTDDEATCIINS